MYLPQGGNLSEINEASPRYQFRFSQDRRDLLNSLTAFGNVLSSERGAPFRTHVEGEPRELNPGAAEDVLLSYR